MLITRCLIWFLNNMEDLSSQTSRLGLSKTSGSVRKWQLAIMTEFVLSLLLRRRARFLVYDLRLTILTFIDDVVRGKTVVILTLERVSYHEFQIWLFVSLGSLRSSLIHACGCEDLWVSTPLWDTIAQSTSNLRRGVLLC